MRDPSFGSHFSLAESRVVSIWIKSRDIELEAEKWHAIELDKQDVHATGNRRLFSAIDTHSKIFCRQDYDAILILSYSLFKKPI